MVSYFSIRSSNCTLLLTPKINPEVRAIMKTSHYTRDPQINNGLSAMGKALNVTLEEEQYLPKNIKEKILSPLADSGRIYVGSFHISNVSKYLICPIFNKTIKEMTDNISLCGFLFAQDIGEWAKNVSQVLGKSKTGSAFRS